MCSAWSFSKCVCSGFSHTFSFSNFQTIWEVDAVVRWRVLKQQPSTQDSKRDTDIKNRLLDSVGEGGGGMIWKNSIETHMYVKQMTSLSATQETGHSKLVHWDNSEGWDGEGGGRGFDTRGHMYTHVWFMSTYGKIHYNIVR